MLETYFLVHTFQAEKNRKQERGRVFTWSREQGASREKVNFWGNLPIMELCGFPSLAGRARELTTLREMSSRSC